MGIVGEKVFHSLLGCGNIINQEGRYVYIKFGDETKIFHYPDSFQSILKFEKSNLQEKMDRMIERYNEKKSELEKISAKPNFVKIREKQREKRKYRIERPNIAFKCNYCDGGANNKYIGFHGVCSDEIIRYNINIEHRVWCSSSESDCYKYLNGLISRHSIENEYNNGYYCCYESQILRDWKALAGIFQKGKLKDKPKHIKNVQSNSLCILTTRVPNSKESERIIFGVFLIDDKYDGDQRNEGFVTTTSKFKIKLSLDEASKMLFWKYYKNEKGNNNKKIAWSSGLFRYLSDMQAMQILHDIYEIKKGTGDESLAYEFCNHFSELIGIDKESIENPSGALV